MAAVNANDVDLAEVLGTRETPALEFKSTAKRQGKRGDAIGNAVCAMANDLCGAGGGDILVGVDDEGRALDGVDVSDTALLALTDLRDDGLAAALKGLGYVNRFGRGIGRVHRSLESNGNPPAEFQIDDASWVVIIRRTAP